jgi:type I restriction enzyme S subunit
MSNPTLADLCTLIVDSEHKTAPKTSRGAHPLIRTTDLGRARVDFAKAQRIDRETYAGWTRRAQPTTGDLILAREAPVGGVGCVPDDQRPALGQRTVLLRPKARIDSRFLMYRLAAPDLQSRMSEMATGATVPHLNMSDIRAFAMPDLPPQREQVRMGAVLGAFDKFMAINERRIDLLETLARSLYNGRFDSPERRKEASDTGGWRPASEIFAIDPKVRSKQETYPVLTMADVSVRFGAAFPAKTVSRASGSRYQQNDVLLARITPCLENGKTALVKFLGEQAMGVGSTEFIVLRGRTVGPAFTYCAARSERLRRHAIKSMSGASGRQRVSPQAFDSLELVEPAPAAADEFERLAGPLLGEAYERAVQNRALLRTRDLLLPRLVSGRVDLSDIDLGNLLSPDAA